MLLLPTAAQATTYPIFASGPDVHTGKIESLWGTIDVTTINGYGYLSNPHLYVTGYSQAADTYVGLFSYYQPNPIPAAENGSEPTTISDSAKMRWYR
jgi:hypothetical protein